MAMPPFSYTSTYNVKITNMSLTILLLGANTIRVSTFKRTRTYYKPESKLQGTVAFSPCAAPETDLEI